MLVGLSSLYNNINVGLGQCTAGLREMLLCFYVMFFMYGHVSGCVSSDTDCNPLCPGVGKFCTNHKYGFSSGTFELFTQKCLNNDINHLGQQCECTSSSSSGEGSWDGGDGRYARMEGVGSISSSSSTL